MILSFESAVSVSAAAVRLRPGLYAGLSRCTPRTGHGPYFLGPSVWLHSKPIPLRKALCDGHGNMDHSQGHQCNFNISVEKNVAELCFPLISLGSRRKGCCSNFESAVSASAGAVRPGHDPYSPTVSLYSSHQTRPIVPPYVCLGALEVPPLC